MRKPGNSLCSGCGVSKNGSFSRRRRGNKLIIWIAGFGLVSGTAGCSSTPTAFTNIDVPGAVSTHTCSINNASSEGCASIVGYYVDNAGNINGFQWDTQTDFVTLIVDEAIEVKAYDTNNFGCDEIVGAVRDTFGQRAFPLDGGFIAESFSDMSGKSCGFPVPPGFARPISVFNDLSMQTFGINNTRRMVGTLREATGEFSVF